MIKLLTLLTVLALTNFITSCTAEDKMITVNSYHITEDFTPDAQPEKAVWQNAKSSYTIDTDWQGKEKSPELTTTVKSLWSDTYLYLLYEAKFDVLAVNKEIQPDENDDCYNIWNYDVAEIFIGDNPDIKKYFEFVVSPINQKIDICHDRNLPGSEGADLPWSSGWSIACKIDEEKKIWYAEFRIPLKAISVQPIAAGKEYRANLFRCAHDTGDRKYLALNPTHTDRPNYHVPEKFGRLKLVTGE